MGGREGELTILKAEKITIIIMMIMIIIILSKHFFFNFIEQLLLEWCQLFRLTQQTQTEHHNSFEY